MDTDTLSSSGTSADSPNASNLMSPASKQHAASSELTPRSKYRAMMAAIDDESDSDAPAGSEDALVEPADRTSPVRGQILGDKASESTETSDEDAIQRIPAPRGRLAARLQKQSLSGIDGSQSGSNSRDNAYARMKKKLADPAVKITSKEEPTYASQATSATDEDDILPANMDRRKRSRQEAPVGLKSPIAPMHSPQLPSPGLFMSPDKGQGSVSPASPVPTKTLSQPSGLDSDLSEAPQANSKFLALVARKREERLAKEAEAMSKTRARESLSEDRAGQKKQSRKNKIREERASSDSDSGGSGAAKLTQQARPTRKASKKALEEMNRETQRMSRNMQLAHQARTKKKITKESLFARFNFRTGNMPPSVTVPPHSSSAVSSDVASDTDARTRAETPPTSPLTPGDAISKENGINAERPKLDDTIAEEQSLVLDDDLPDIQDMIKTSQVQVDQRKHRAVQDLVADQNSVVYLASTKGRTIANNPVRVRMPKIEARRDPTSGSDSDLEILQDKKNKRKVNAIFDRLPASKTSDAHPLQTLRSLAHIGPSNEYTSGTKASMSLADMQTTLQKRARQQAARERAEKIQELKDRGVIIQTAEERQKDQAEVEDLLEKARQEAANLKEKEKDRAKREARANGEEVADDSSEDDEDYQENDADESDIELSGSEEESEDQVGEEGEGIEGEGGHNSNERDISPHHGGLIADEASEDSEDIEDIDKEEGPNEEDEASIAEKEVNRPSTRRRHQMIIPDDDDDDDDKATQEDQGGNVPPTQVAPNFMSNLGLPAFLETSMGMTQAFAATMAESQTEEDGRPEVTDKEEDSLAFLGPPPEPEFPVFDTEDSLQMITDSQEMHASNPESQAKIDLHLSQFQIPPDSLDDTAEGPSATQLSDIPDPTQDIGFALSSPVAGRFAPMPPSTVDTVIVQRADVPDSPVVKKKGRLRRRTDTVLDDDPDKAVDVGQEERSNVISADAFDVLKRGSKKSFNEAQQFDKKKSNAHEMVEEQAQESEDEYAGLGGASDDESHGEEDEEVRKMIEQGEVDVDERQLAAFYADKERASDEKALEKLFKDINNGMLRRKRGADFDISDSEDDVEARHRRKRREFAKMRKALLESQNVGKIAEDPKKMAFLRAIEDREDDEDLDLLEQQEDLSQPALDVDSQEVPDSQPQKGPEESDRPALGKRKRPLTESNQNTTNRHPPAARRTITMRKPLSMADIQASVSFLIEEPDAMPIPPPSSSPVASDNENDENEQSHQHNSMDPPGGNPVNHNQQKPNPFASRRRRTAPVIDRLSLKRESSSSISTSNLAFQTPSANAAHPTFKIPSLLRRATSSSFNKQADSNGISTLADTERNAGGKEKGEFVRRGGVRGSSVNFQARNVVLGVEERVQELVRRKVRREGSGLVGLGGGSFE